MDDNGIAFRETEAGPSAAMPLLWAISTFRRCASPSFTTNVIQSLPCRNGAGLYTITHFAAGRYWLNSHKGTKTLTGSPQRSGIDENLETCRKPCA